MNVNRLRRSVLSKIVVAIATTVVSPVSFAGENKTSRKNSTHRIEIRQFKFAPDRLKIMPGDTVIWHNLDIVPHTATALDSSWDSGNILPKESKIITFSQDSALSYYCFYHQGMTAQIDLGSL